MELIVVGEPFQQYADELGARPETWDQLQLEELEQLFQHQLLLIGITRDQNRVGPLQDLYGLAQRRLSSDTRLAVLLRVAAFCEITVPQRRSYR